MQHGKQLEPAKVLGQGYAGRERFRSKEPRHDRASFNRNCVTMRFRSPSPSQWDSRLWNSVRLTPVYRNNLPNGLTCDTISSNGARKEVPGVHDPIAHYTKGRGFKSPRLHNHGGVAQLVEHLFDLDRAREESSPPVRDRTAHKTALRGFDSPHLHKTWGCSSVAERLSPVARMQCVQRKSADPVSVLFLYALLLVSVRNRSLVGNVVPAAVIGLRTR